MEAGKRVVIIGSGFGGLTAAKGLKKANCELLVIDKTNHHLFQPLLYQVATAALSPAEIATPIREILRKQENTAVIMGEVTHIDKVGKMLTLQNGEKIPFDTLIVATGARHSYFGNDAWEAFAPGIKTIKDAIAIREEILLSFEKAERLKDPQEAAQYLNFVIIGAGPTGVELAGAIAEISQRTLFKNFRHIKPENAKIYLIEAAPYILPTYPPSLSEQARRDLEALSVTVITGKKVTQVSEAGVQVEETFYPCKNVIWAAGNQASPLLQTLEVPLDRGGRALTESDLSIPGHPDIFVIGDAACLLGADGKPLPGIAPTAIQQGKYVAKLIREGTPKERRKPFAYFDKGSMATIGRGKAIAMVGSLKFKGLLAWLMWCFIHIVYLIGFRNRLSVIMQWFMVYLTGQRGARIIYRSIDTTLPKK